MEAAPAFRCRFCGKVTRGRPTETMRMTGRNWANANSFAKCGALKLIGEEIEPICLMALDLEPNWFMAHHFALFPTWPAHLLMAPCCGVARLFTPGARRALSTAGPLRRPCADQLNARDFPWRPTLAVKDKQCRDLHTNWLGGQGQPSSIPSH